MAKMYPDDVLEPVLRALIILLHIPCVLSATTLLRGGTIIAYNNATADLEVIPQGSILFSDTILAISKTIDGLDAHLKDNGVKMVNATGKIISPGFVDTHRHTWQTAMRTLGPNILLSSYMWMFGNKGPAAFILSPEDIHISSLMGTLEGLNAGVTTTLDYAHMTWSRAHSEAALQGVIESGARVWFAYNIGSAPVSEDPIVFNNSAADQLAHVNELAKSSPFNNGLVTLGLSYDMLFPDNPLSTQIVETARNLSMIITVHDVGVVYAVGSNTITATTTIPVDPPALSSDLTWIFAHCSSITPKEARMLKQANQYISITPESEMHYGHGHLHTFALQDQASLGVDTHFTFSIDMIAQMRIWLQSTRLQLFQEEMDKFKIPSDTPMTVKQAFLLGTRNGGLALKRPDLGVLMSGAKADILVFSTDAIGLIGWSDPIAAIVLHSNVRDIEDIYVDGKLVKSGGKLTFDWQGKGLGSQLQSVAKKFKDGLAKTNISAFMQFVFQSNGYTAEDFQAPFEVDVTRGNGTGF